MNQKRKFTPELKKEAIALVTKQGYTVAKAAASPGISDKTLHTWVTLARNRLSRLSRLSLLELSRCVMLLICPGELDQTVVGCSNKCP